MQLEAAWMVPPSFPLPTAGSPKMVITEVLVDSRVPKDCSSPGWIQAPYDIATLLGSYVYFNCRSSIEHSQVAWLYNGRENIMLTPQAFRVVLWNGNSSLRYGPIQYNDSGVSIGCEVTTEFGKLPSTMGTITVNSKTSRMYLHGELCIVDSDNCDNGRL